MVRDVIGGDVTLMSSWRHDAENVSFLKSSVASVAVFFLPSPQIILFPFLETEKFISLQICIDAGYIWAIY